MPSAVERPAPTSAPATRAVSIVARDTPSAATRWAGGIVSPMSAFRITWSFGRMTPDRTATAKTHPGASMPVRARSMSDVARTAKVARIAQSMTRPPRRSPSTPNIGAARVPSCCSEPNAVRSRTEPVLTITYQPSTSDSISKAHEVSRSAGIWKRKLRTRKAASITGASPGREPAQLLEAPEPLAEHVLRVDAVVEAGLPRLDRAHQRRRRRLRGAGGELEVGVDEPLADEFRQA